MNVKQACYILSNAAFVRSEALIPPAIPPTIIPIIEPIGPPINVPIEAPKAAPPAPPSTLAAPFNICFPELIKNCLMVIYPLHSL